MSGPMPKMEGLEGRRLLTGLPGFPDTSFGNQGEVRTEVPGIPGTVVASVLATDGSLFYLSQVNGTSTSSKFLFEDLPGALAVTKITPLGQIDTSFGKQGRFTFTALERVTEARSLVLLPDGSLIAGGGISRGQVAESTDVLLVKIEPSGVIDAEFGTGGFQTFDAGTTRGGTALAAETVTDIELYTIAGPNRIMVLSGSADGSSTLLKVNALNGQLDTTFGGVGAVNAVGGFTGVAAALGTLDLDGQGRIYLGVFGPSDNGIARLLADGTADTGFGVGGVRYFATQFAAGDIEDTSQGLFYVYPSANSGRFASTADGYSVVGLNTVTGATSAAFNGGVAVSVPLLGAREIQVFPRADGSFIVSAADQGNITTSVVFARFNGVGRDGAFGGGGTINVSLQGPQARSVVAFRPDDRFLIVPTPLGGEETPREVRAYTAGGSLDGTFNAGGSLPGSLTVVETAGGAVETQSVVRTAAGGIVALQSQYEGRGVFRSFVARFSGAGAFLGREELVNQGPGGHFSATSLKLMPLPDGRILVGFGGTGGLQLGLALLDASGTLDTTFGSGGFQPITFPPGLNNLGGFAGPRFALDSTGSGVFIAGSSGDVFRVGLDGLRSGFGPSGFVQSTETFTAVTGDSAGGALLASFASSQQGSRLLVTSLSSAAAAVPGFNGGQPLASTLGLGGSQFIDPRVIVRLANNRIAVGGSVFVQNGGNFEARYFMLLLNGDGTPVVSFGNSGVVFGPTQDLRGSGIYDISDYAIGGYIVVGENRGAAFLGRLDAAGALDGNFGNNTNATSTNSSDRFSSLVVDPLGQPVVGGWISEPGAAQRSARVVRFNAPIVQNPPTVNFTAPLNPATGATQFEFTLSVAPFSGRVVDTASFGDADVTVTLSGAPAGTVTFSRFTGDPAVSLQVVYTLTAPAGGFDSGPYSFSLATNAIADTAYAVTPSRLLGERTYTFGGAPTVVLSSPANPAAGANQIEFFLTITPAAGRSINSSSLESSDVTVTLPGGGQANVVFSRFSGSTSVAVDAFYTIVQPAGGFVGGDFTFALADNAISDSFGFQTPAQALGVRTFTFGAATLGVSSVVVNASQATQGGPLPVSFTVSNSGTVASLPTTATIELVSFDGSTVILGTRLVGVIAAGGGGTIDVTGLTVPPDRLDGEYTVRVGVGSATRSSALFAIFAPPPVVGSLDSTFGGGDGVVVNVIAGAAITTTASQPIPGGRIVSVGFNTDGNVTVVRTAADGSTDTTFGPSGDGRLIVDLRGTFDVATSLLIDGQGRIFAIGYSLDPTGGGATAFVLGITPGGVLDTSFASGGISLLAPASLAGQVVTPRFAQLDPQGRLLVVGANRATTATDAESRAFVLRVAPDGSADASFGVAGVALPNLSPGGGAFSFSTALLLPTGQLVLGGAAAETPGAPRRFLITRLDPAGNLDAKFGRKGLLLLPAAAGSQDRVTTLVAVPATPTGLGPRGAIYAGGVRGAADGGSSQGVIFRITARGAVDRSFARGLAALLSPGATVSTVSGIVVQAVGRVLISLTTASSSTAFQNGSFGVTLVRLDVKGAPDRFFNRGQPLVVVAVPTGTSAAQPVTASFDDFAQSRQGQVNAIEGGAVRLVATRPTTGGTELRVAGIVPDGVDLDSVLTAARLPATVAPGFKSTAVLTVSNAGSLDTRGAFSVTLVARPTSGGNEVVLRTARQTRAVKAGATLKLKLPIALARTIAPGQYILSARVESTFTELSRANNSPSRTPAFTVATPPGRAGFSLNPIHLRPQGPSLGALGDEEPELF